MIVNAITSEEFCSRTISSLKHGNRAKPMYTIVLGSGASTPVTPSTKGLILLLPWYLFQRSRSEKYDLLHPDITHGEYREFRRRFWQLFTSSAITVSERGDLIVANGDPSALSRTYTAAMSPAASSALAGPWKVEEFLKRVISASDNRISVPNFVLAALLTNNQASDLKRIAATVVTTNFDLQLQRALQICQQLYAISDTPASIQELDVHAFGWTHLIHAHGSAFRYNMANTDSEIKEWAQALGGLSGVYSADEVLVLGYGGWDDGVLKSLRELPEEKRITWVDRVPIAACDQLLSSGTLDLLRNRPNTQYLCSDLTTLLIRIQKGVSNDLLPLSLREPLAMAKNSIDMIQMPANPSTLPQAWDQRLGHAYGAGPEIRAFQAEAERVQTYTSRVAAWAQLEAPAHLTAGNRRVLPPSFSYPGFMIERLIYEGQYAEAEKEAMRTYSDNERSVNERNDAAHKAARLLGRRGEAEQARELFKSIYSNVEVHDTLRAMAFANFVAAKLDEANYETLTELDSWLLRINDSRAEALLLKVKAHIEIGLERLDEAILTCSRLCALPEEDALSGSDALSRLGHSLLKERRHLDAGRVLRDSIRLGSCYGITMSKDIILLAITDAAAGRNGIAVQRLITLLATAHPEDRKEVSSALSQLTAIIAISSGDADHVLNLARKHCDPGQLQLSEILCASVYFVNGNQEQAKDLLAVIESKEIERANCLGYLLTAIRIHHKEKNYSQVRSLLPKLLLVGRKIGGIVDFVAVEMLESLKSLEDNRAEEAFLDFIIRHRSANEGLLWRAAATLSESLFNRHEYLGAVRNSVLGIRCVATPAPVKGLLLIRIAAVLLHTKHPKCASAMRVKGHCLVEPDSPEFFESQLLKAMIDDQLGNPAAIVRNLESVLMSDKCIGEQRIRAHKMLIGVCLAVGDFANARANAQEFERYGFGADE